MMNFIKIVSAIVLLTIFAMSSAHAQHSFAGYSLDQLETELEDAQIFQTLGQANTAANGFRGCSQYKDEMLGIRQALIRLTEQYEGRADSIYEQKRQQMQEQFRLANKSYETCYAQTLADYPNLSSAGVRTLANFKSKVAELNPKFADKGDIADYIAAIEDTIENIKNQSGKEVGIVESIFKRVQVRRAGAAWQDLSKGQAIFMQDELRTGPRGRLRIKFSDHFAAGNVGPTVVNIGSESHIKIEKFLVSFTNPPKREGVVKLLRGSVRAFTKNWGPHSNFMVRAGATVCGIRGTEVAISYDPVTETATHILDHGDAYLEAGGRKVTLTPRTSVTVKGDQVEWPVSVSEDTWMGIMKSTGDGALGAANTEVAVLSDQAPAPALDISQVAPSPNPAITMKDALETFRAYQISAISSDQESLLSLLAEPEKSFALDVIATRGLEHYSIHNSDYQSWETRCVACFDNKTEGSICVIHDRRTMDRGRYHSNDYLLRNINGIPYITERAHSKRSRDLRKLQKKNGRVCEFDELTINLMNAGGARTSEKDGLKTLLKGIGTVLGEID